MSVCSKECASVCFLFVVIIISWSARKKQSTINMPTRSVTRFGEISPFFSTMFKNLDHIEGVNLVFGYILTLFGQILFAIGQIFIVVNGQI